MKRNPFKIHGIVDGEHFTDRVPEVARMIRTLKDPGSKLLVYGPRRMGKTSAILNAIEAVNVKGGHAFLADLSTASSAVDMGNRILASAARVIGRRWRNFLGEVVSRLNVTVSLVPDPTSGVPVPSVDVNLRGESTERQRQTFISVLDALDSGAGKRGITIGLALDEFQELHKFGGDAAEWDLRATIQRHTNVGYILAGSRQHVIERMIAPQGALYKLTDKLAFGPIDPGHLADWIDRRLVQAGIAGQGAGHQIVRMAGPQTRDVVQVARRLFDLEAVDSRLREDAVQRAFIEIVAEEGDLLNALWQSLTSLQQNTLRAVAATTKGLTTRQTIVRFSLGASGTATNAVNGLVKSGILFRDDPYTGRRVATPTGYDFDSPFFKAWVMAHTLTDLGLPPPGSLPMDRTMV